jgi:hypothetical protein
MNKIMALFIIGFSAIVVVCFTIFMMLIPVIGYRKSELWLNSFRPTTVKVWGAISWIVFVSIFLTVAPLFDMMFGWGIFFEKLDRGHRIHSLIVSGRQGDGGDLYFGFMFMYSILASRVWEKLHGIVKMRKKQRVAIYKNGWFIEFH